MAAPANPFAGDPDRAAIWEMLVARDIEAYARQDWEMVAGDFIEAGFFGFSGGRSIDAGTWRMAYPDLAAYRTDWLAQAAETAATADMEKLPAALHELSRLDKIDVDGGCAVARKCFDGAVPLADGSESEPLKWQTFYVCRRTEDRWRIQGFFGYLPHPLG